MQIQTEKMKNDKITQDKPKRKWYDWIALFGIAIFIIQFFLNNLLNVYSFLKSGILYFAGGLLGVLLYTFTLIWILNKILKIR